MVSKPSLVPFCQAFWRPEDVILCCHYLEHPEGKVCHLGGFSRTCAATLGSSLPSTFLLAVGVGALLGYSCSRSERVVLHCASPKEQLMEQSWRDLCFRELAGIQTASDHQPKSRKLKGTGHISLSFARKSQTRTLNWIVWSVSQTWKIHLP